MFTSNVYHVMIGAPSDIKEEIQIAKDIIFHWDMINSHLHHCVILPLHWNDSTYPTTGNPPQKSIDKQMVERSDLMVCIFCSRLGSPTDTHISGSVEEIEEHIKAGKTVMTFFRKNMFTPQNDKDIEQLQKLIEYKKSIRDSVYWGEYESVKDFEKIFREKLELFLNNNWLNKLNGMEIVQHELSDYDKERLTKWVKSENPKFNRTGNTNGRHMFILGDNNRFVANNSEEYAEWENFLERMTQLGYTELTTHNSKGQAFYRLKYPAFEFVKQLERQTNDER